MSPPKKEKDSDKICVGMIAGTHGVRGLVKLRSFTDDPEALVDYAPLTDASGTREFVIELCSVANEHFVAAIEGIESKEAADAVRGLKLYADRSRLPMAGKREYYNADLMGLAAFAADGKSYGTVLGVFDHGAGAFLEIGTSKKDSFMLPFTDAYVPDVLIAEQKITVIVPEGWLNKEKPEKPEKSEKAKKKPSAQEQ